MCGITGFISSKYSKKDLERMTDIIQRRGPDAAGYYYDEPNHIGLGHRRLSIIDLSEAANQPFYSSSGRYITVFNGEIYNFKDLKAKYNLITKTSSDTEIVIELYEKLGITCFNEFNGMFAVAIWDIIDKKLIIARDRIGKKPLYYNTEKGKFSFSSELKSLLVIDKQSVNKKAIPYYLHLGYLPADLSFYANIKKLPSGNILTYQNDKIEIKPFWEIEPSIHQNKNISEGEALKKVENLVETSVAYRLIADVPLGSFLSGGIDSSLVTAIAQKQKSSAIKTFSIGFKESKFNESVFAKKVAEHLKTDHHEFILSVEDAKSKVVDLLSIYDEPYTDSSAIPTLLVSEMARKHVTVALSGDGGDELFMGYGMYDWAKRLSSFPYKQFHNSIAWGFQRFGNNRVKRIGDVLQYPKNTFLPSHIFSQEQYLFSKEEINNLLVHPIQAEMEDSKFYGIDTLPPNMLAEEIQSAFDLKNYLQEDLMVKVDRASMYHSLEVRSPLLDYRLIEFAFSLPMDLRKNHEGTKHLLKKILYKHVPKEMFDRPKWGFSIPLADWLLEDLKYLFEENLQADIILKYDVVKLAEVQKLQSRFFNGEKFLYNKLWALILLHQWLIKMDT